MEPERAGDLAALQQAARQRLGLLHVGEGEQAVGGAELRAPGGGQAR
ncbi:hypothetical protein G5V59_06185 [Nocardioides sp. W3-2-3]|nr:hypothetical protein [Nocardioides convexus]NGZ99966.1 hypothetical protein [Nocardioides convexus]